MLDLVVHEIDFSMCEVFVFLIVRGCMSSGHHKADLHFKLHCGKRKWGIYTTINNDTRQPRLLFSVTAPPPTTGKAILPWPRSDALCCYWACSFSTYLLINYYSQISYWISRWLFELGLIFDELPEATPCCTSILLDVGLCPCNPFDAVLSPLCTSSAARDLIRPRAAVNHSS